jgi:hypothetical protein
MVKSYKQIMVLMTESASARSFEALSIPRQGLAPAVTNSSYRIYKDADNHVVIQAPSALEALQASGVTTAYKIQRETVSRSTVVAPNDWPKSVPVEAAPAATDAPAAENPPPTTDAAAPPAEAVKS